MMSSQRRATALATLIAGLIAMGTTSAAVDGDKPLYFSLIVSSAPTLNTFEVVSAVDYALEVIQNDAVIPSGYSLQYSRVLDTQVRHRIARLAPLSGTT